MRQCRSGRGVSGCRYRQVITHGLDVLIDFATGAACAEQMCGRLVSDHEAGTVQLCCEDKTYVFVCDDQSAYTVGCREEKLLCLGHTHQVDHRAVLQRLARLPYVSEIHEAFFE